MAGQRAWSMRSPSKWSSSVSSDTCAGRRALAYKPVDLDDPASVANAVHEWAKEDLVLGSCGNCAA